MEETVRGSVSAHDAIQRVKDLFSPVIIWHLEIEGMVATQGAHVTVQTDSAAPVQIDGECAGLVPDRGRGLFGVDVRVLPSVLRVLAP